MKIFDPKIAQAEMWALNNDFTLLMLQREMKRLGFPRFVHDAKNLIQRMKARGQIYFDRTVWRPSDSIIGLQVKRREGGS